jgi:hypothetical protein
MNVTLEDSRLLLELCEQHGVSAEKVLKTRLRQGQTVFGLKESS